MRNFIVFPGIWNPLFGLGTFMAKTLTKVVLPFLVVLVFAFPAVGQETGPSGFDKLLRDCDGAAQIVDAERKRLGDRFEKELLDYLGQDVEKHFQISCHLSACCRGTSDPATDRLLESLSLLIRQQALALLRNKTDSHSLYMTVTIQILSAVQSEHLGFHSLAVAHKSAAERLVSEKPILKGGYPALTAEDWKLYDSLPKQSVAPQKKRKRSRR